MTEEKAQQQINTAAEILVSGLAELMMSRFDVYMSQAEAADREQRKKDAEAGYATVRELSDHYSLSDGTTRELVSGLQKHTDRYGDTAVLRNRRILRIKKKAFLDWMRYGDAIEAGMSGIPKYQEEADGNE